MTDIETANVTPTGSWDFTGATILKVKTPGTDPEASTKKYVDDAVGGISSHTRLHAVDGASDHSLGSGTTGKLVQFDTTNILKNASNTDAEVAGAVTHAADNTQAHSDYLLNSGADVAVGPLTTTADNSSADTAYVPMVLYNTDATPPAANTVPIGTIYIQYTA